MCVLLYRPAGVKMPSYDILKACATKNPDGFGFATPTMSFKSLDFYEFYRELIKVKRNEDCILHFRYATHGSIKESNCHPFYDSVNGGTYMAHNGILDIRPTGDMTDSETAFKKYIVPTIRKYGFFSKELDNVVRNIIGGSKFAIMSDGNVRTFGDFKVMDGVYYSNLYFMPYTMRYYRDYGYAV